MPCDITVEEARRQYVERYGDGETIVTLTMTDNEIEELIKTCDYVVLLSEMWHRSERNAESIKSARISYAGY